MAKQTGNKILKVQKTGQTISAAIVDIVPPPKGKKLSLYKICVALSPSSGRDTVRLLRSSDGRLLMEPLDFDLLAEDHRLDQLNATTARWRADLQNAANSNS
ncbi:hypothetical protein FRC07_008899 [Ceratobasidium sp. 392]|nr:hypothetical protein FRC07_008899 [Ceratobasidium sp. 392]